MTINRKKGYPRNFIEKYYLNSSIKTKSNVETNKQIILSYVKTYRKSRQEYRGHLG